MTVSEIITEALLNLGVIAANEDPSASDQATCLVTFKNMLHSLPGMGLGGQLTDVVIKETPYEAKPNERITWDGVGAFVVTFPQFLDIDTSRKRPPNNGDRVEITSGSQAGVYFFIAPTRTWFAIDTMTAATQSPLGANCDQSLIDMLAFKVARKFGERPTPELAAANDKAERVIAARFAPDMSGDIDPALWSYWGQWNGALA